MNSRILETIQSYAVNGSRIVIVVLLTALILWLLVKLYRMIRLLCRDQVCLSIDPPARSDRQADATKQLFVAVHSLGLPQAPIERLMHYVEPIVFEITASKQNGIKYRIRVSKEKAASLRQHILSYVPDALTSIEPFVRSKTITNPRRIISFRQRSHYAFPLQNQDFLETHDPIGYLTSAMTKLTGDEQITYQLVVVSAKMREADSLRTKIMNNEDLLTKLTHQHAQHGRVITGTINKLLFGLADVVTTSYHGSSKAEYMTAQKDLQYEKQVAKRLKPVRTLSYFEHELVESVHIKLSQPLFKADVRVCIEVGTTAEYRKRRKSIDAGLGLFSVPKYQSLRADYIYAWMSRYRAFLFDKGLPSVLSRPNILAASELAGLYHFPNSFSAKTENVVKSLSKTLPAPVSLKNGSKLDILLGENQHHGSNTAIGLTASERERHVYIIGGTGNGKTTMLLYGIVQDITSGKGVTVLDPHGDLAETILHHIPEHRIKDVIYLNPDDLTHPIGINLLELMPGLTGDDLLREKDLITESTISVLRKIFSEDDSGGHRIEYVLRNTIQTALTIEGATLFTIFRLLNDTKYRRGIVKMLEDNDLKNFWNNELGKAGEFQRVKMSAGITAKIGRFLFSASAKRILEQEKSTIEFDDILNSGKILICNFSKGLLGEDTSTLFGTTILAKLQVAALRRARIKQVNRTPYHLYVDEFQNFATMSFVQMLSEARKYKLYLTMAEQSTSQQDEQRLVDIILANVGTVICFRSGSPADERLILPLFFPYVEQGEISNLPAYSFYARIAAVQSQEPMSGRTVLLKSEGNEVVARAVIAHTQAQYGARKQDEKTVENDNEVIESKQLIRKTPKLLKKSPKIQDAAPTV